MAAKSLSPHLPGRGPGVLSRLGAWVFDLVALIAILSFAAFFVGVFALMAPAALLAGVVAGLADWRRQRANTADGRRRVRGWTEVRVGAVHRAARADTRPQILT